MLHLIPDDDGLPHAPTPECGCDPHPGRWGGRVILVHLPPDQDEHEAEYAGFVFDDSTLTAERIHTALVRDQLL